MTLKERQTPKNSNYLRFYQFEPVTSTICSNCPAKCGTGNWDDVLARVRGVPVHTNWPAASGQSISLIYICESPSIREFSHGLPAVGTTGQQIYRHENELNNVQAGWLDWLDDNVFRTNLVRCHADSGLQKRVDRKKNVRVKEAATHCIEHLKLEIKAIVESSQAEFLRFVVAIGRGFPEWEEAVATFIKTTCESAGKEHDVTVDAHPSA
ncbi:hypothetical protein LXT21_44640 [Myxococcus sp. K38C18041901]|uniref:hypothetical protein n=1 Tax=Myxococcus guangdongensis TaxID=2906760 RepID=UPI0020A7D040|nr:hypothetical protein [Myxococcus guangdongensis]MCP3065874.1 hypothetical protein [Myxococcus guangdongensis]